MKKAFTLLVCALALTMLPAAARAESSESTETPDGVVSLTLTLPESVAPYAYRLTDDYVNSRVSFRMKDTLVIVPQQSAQVLVLNWYDVPASYTVTQLDAAGQTLSEETITDSQLGRKINLDANCATINVLFDENGSLGGVVAYADAASAPAAFTPAPTQCDLLIISVEPGMEFCEFGAVLPTYSKEKGISTAVLYVSDYGKRARAYEALAGLSEAGYTEYPIFGGYESDNYDSYDVTQGQFDRRAFVEYLKAEIQALNPKVIVTHGVADVSGAHRLVAECVQIAVKECPSVEKLYCFGQTEGTSATIVDMSTPLNFYAGKTAAEVAQRAYDQHVSRKIFGLTIDPTSAYTLAFTTVGEDEAKNDLFEHIDTTSLLTYAVATPSPSPEPEATSTPVQDAQTEQETQPNQPSQPSQQTGTGGIRSIFTMPVLLCFGGGAALSALLFLVLYKRLRISRSKGDAICICVIPLALGVAIGAVLAGTKVEQHAVLGTSAISAAKETPLPSNTPEASETSEVSMTPEMSATPDASADPQTTTDPDAQYYRSANDPAEVIVVDVTSGRWEYRSDNLGISIERVSTKTKEGKPLTYFVADIHMRDISEFRPGFGAEGHTGRGAIHPWLIARREKAVLWITGDNLINDEREEKGILIRDGRMFWSGEKEDTLAIYSDMSMRIIKKGAMTPGTLLEDGVENAYSFGPTLIDNGVINENAKFHRVRRANPRTGIGYLSPGHYIAIVVDGRQKDYSVGLPVWELADLFASYGCTVAYNLDGGLSAAMIFMGEQLNSHSGTRTGGSENISYQRAVPDGLMFGYSTQVPSVDDPIANNGNKG